MTNRDVFLLYLSLISILLVFVPFVLLILQKVFRKNVASVWRIYNGWLFMAPLFLLFVFLGRVIFILGVLGLSAFSFWEFASATGLNREKWITYVVHLGIFCVAILALIRDPSTGQYGGYGMFMALPVYVVGLIVFVPIFQNRYEGQLRSVALGMMGFMYFGWMLGHLGFLADSAYPNHYVLFIVFSVQMADIAAYNFGKLFGRHKLRGNISPNKTLEGSIGALCVSLCLPWLFRPTLSELGSLQLLLAGLIIGIGSQLGDLVISLIKRDMGIKDMGALIPGHGGVLDRIDSLIIATPLFFHMIRYFQMLYP